MRPPSTLQRPVSTTLGCRRSFLPYAKLIGHAHGGRIFGLRGQQALRRADRDAVFGPILTTRLVRSCRLDEYFYPTPKCKTSPQLQVG